MILWRLFYILCLFGMSIIAASAHAQTPRNGIYLHSLETDLCLVAPDDIARGTRPAPVNRCGYDNEESPARWTISQAPSGNWHIVHRETGDCLGAQNVNQNGGIVSNGYFSDCEDGVRQEWRFTVAGFAGDSLVRVVNAANEQCLTVEEEEEFGYAGTVITAPCTDTVSTVWSKASADFVNLGRRGGVTRGYSELPYFDDLQFVEGGTLPEVPGQPARPNSRFSHAFAQGHIYIGNLQDLDDRLFATSRGNPSDDRRQFSRLYYEPYIAARDRIPENSWQRDIATLKTSSHWPMGIVRWTPYCNTEPERGDPRGARRPPNFTVADMRAIEGAIADLERAGKIVFIRVPARSADALKFCERSMDVAGRTSAYPVWDSPRDLNEVGTIEGRHVDLNIEGGWDKGTVLQLLMVQLGYWPDINREGADVFVSINRGNIRELWQSQFTAFQNLSVEGGRDYDPASISHPPDLLGPRWVYRVGEPAIFARRDERSGFQPVPRNRSLSEGDQARIDADYPIDWTPFVPESRPADAPRTAKLIVSRVFSYHGDGGLKRDPVDFYLRVTNGERNMRTPGDISDGSNEVFPSRWVFDLTETDENGMIPFTLRLMDDDTGGR